MTWHGTSVFTSKLVIITEDQRLMLAELAENSEYWNAANDFIQQMKGRWLPSLTDRQEDWYHEIQARLAVDVNRREARIAFGLEKEDE